MSLLLTLALLAIIFGSLHYFINGRGPQVIALELDYFTWLAIYPKGEHTRWEAEVDLPTEFGVKTIGLHAEDACRK
jgi:hypothetical protein